MVNEQKLHHASATFLRQRRICADAHSLRNVLRATNLRTRHPVDNRLAVRAEIRFPVRTHSWHPHLDQTHSTVARRTEFFVITISRHVRAGFGARSDTPRPRGKMLYT